MFTIYEILNGRFTRRVISSTEEFCLKSMTHLMVHAVAEDIICIINSFSNKCFLISKKDGMAAVHILQIFQSLLKSLQNLAKKLIYPKNVFAYQTTAYRLLSYQAMTVTCGASIAISNATPN